MRILLSDNILASGPESNIISPRFKVIGPKCKITGHISEVTGPSPIFIGSAPTKLDYVKLISAVPNDLEPGISDLGSRTKVIHIHSM